MKEMYFDTIVHIEKLHHLFLEVIKVELDRRRIYDINNVQCFILYNIGDNKLSVGEISNRGYYLGSNVTYNLKKMVQNGYIIQEQAAHDRRSSYVCLSDKGKAFYGEFQAIFARHAENLPHNGINEHEIKNLTGLLNRLESFWSFLITHGIK